MQGARLVDERGAGVAEEDPPGRQDEVGQAAHPGGATAGVRLDEPAAVERPLEPLWNHQPLLRRTLRILSGVLRRQGRGGFPRTLGAEHSG